MFPHLALSPGLPPLPRATGRSRPTGLVPGTLVETPEGPLPVEFLLAGDLVLTRNGPQELRGTSVLQGLALDLVVLDAPASGAPPLVLPASQPVLVSDWRARVLHGQETMLVPAASLIDDRRVRREHRAAQRLIRLHFDAPQVFRANGIEVASARTRAPLSVHQRWLH